MKIGIIGLGLIGGSLLKDLSKNKNYELYAVTGNKQTINKAKVLTKNISYNINILENCEVVFVSVPINKTLEILDKLEEVVSTDCIVLDCASVKEFVMQKQRPYKFIGSHPMAGTENKGFDASFSGLFEGAKWVLTPSEGIREPDINLAGEIIRYTKAETIITNAKEHDYAVALISHMPMLVSQALYKAASTNTLALKLAASGFRDMTRLALSNTEMALDMINYNRGNIEKSLDVLNNSIASLKEYDYLYNIELIKQERSKMYSDKGKNII